MTTTMAAKGGDQSDDGGKERRVETRAMMEARNDGRAATEGTIDREFETLTIGEQGVILVTVGFTGSTWD
ncbi:hypothetical protein L6452_32186 [Arctium lappa]|uniref:Uncharacterized protein n=1 Tax=Arctium lappa TaxID=4217 RepID=A0ACB8Z3L7_ARCLA|nr:hypothetical protein L6452_32186 [Arctium lappa]